MDDENVDPRIGVPVELRSRPFPADQVPQTFMQHFAFVFDSMQMGSTDEDAIAASLVALRNMDRDKAVSLTRYHQSKQITLAQLVKSTANATYHQLYFENLYPERFYDDNITADGLHGSFGRQWVVLIPRRIRQIDRLLERLMTDDPDSLRETRQQLVERRQEMEKIAMKRASQAVRSFR